MVSDKHCLLSFFSFVGGLDSAQDVMGHLYIEVECLIYFIHIFSTNKKFSRHLIFQLKNAAFRNNIHAGNCC